MFSKCPCVELIGLCLLFLAGVAQAGEPIELTRGEAPRERLATYKDYSSSSNCRESKGNRTYGGGLGITDGKNHTILCQVVAE